MALRVNVGAHPGAGPRSPDFMTHLQTSHLISVWYAQHQHLHPATITRNSLLVSTNVEHNLAMLRHYSPDGTQAQHR